MRSKPSEESKQQFFKTMHIDIPPSLLEGLEQSTSNHLTTSSQTRASALTPKPKTRLFLKKNSNQSLFDNIYDGVLITNLSGTILEANDRILDLLRKKRSEIEKAPINSIISGSDANLMKMVLKVLEGSRHVLIQAYCKRGDEHLFPAEITANLMGEHQDRICLFVRDITVRKQSEQILRTAYGAIGNCASGIAVVDLEGKVLYANAATAELWLHESPDSLIGIDLQQLWFEPSSISNILGEVLHSRDPWSGILTSIRDDASTASIQVSVSCNLDEEDEPAGFVLSFLDISERVKAENLLKEARSQEAMMASLAAACHHIGQPATVLLASLNLLQSQMKEITPDIVELLNNINAASDEIAGILQKMRRACVYRTTQYVSRSSRQTHFGTQILDLENCSTS